MVKYDAGDIRNKSIIDSITQHNISDKNIMSIFQRKVQKIVVVMDELDGMNNGDKGGITSLIKLIRPKKTKKQKQEEITMNPIICIGNYHIDKKIKELMKVCYVYELKTPTPAQMTQIIDLTLPSIDATMRKNVIEFVQGNLRKLCAVMEMSKKSNTILANNILHAIFQPKTYNEDIKKITEKLLNTEYPIVRLFINWCLIISARPTTSTESHFRTRFGFLMNYHLSSRRFITIICITNRFRRRRGFTRRRFVSPRSLPNIAPSITTSYLYRTCVFSSRWTNATFLHFS
jgi:hypothetical protein